MVETKVFKSDYCWAVIEGAFALRQPIGSDDRNLCARACSLRCIGSRSIMSSAALNSHSHWLASLIRGKRKTIPNLTIWFPILPDLEFYGYRAIKHRRSPVQQCEESRNSWGRCCDISTCLCWMRHKFGPFLNCRKNTRRKNCVVLVTKLHRLQCTVKITVWLDFAVVIYITHNPIFPLRPNPIEF